MTIPMPRLLPVAFAAVFAASFALAAAPAAHAADLSVSPAVIDGNGVPQDIFNYTLTVTNTSGHQLNVFASVNELTAAGNQPFADPASSNRPALLADWITVSRGAMLFAPGETKTVPVGVNINPYATAGEYHAVISFVEGGTRADAETHLVGAPQALVNFTVASNLKEELSLKSFGPEHRFSSGFPVAVDFAIQNTGDVASIPQGEVIFYDRIGHEVGSAPVNPDSVAIARGETKTFSAAWTGKGGGMGEYKAGLRVTYGAADGQLADTTALWVLPWKELLAIFIALLAVVVIVASLIHREYLKRHHRRKQLIEQVLSARHTIDLKHPKQ